MVEKRISCSDTQDHGDTDQPIQRKQQCKNAEMEKRIYKRRP